MRMFLSIEKWLLRRTAHHVAVQHGVKLAKLRQRALEIGVVACAGYIAHPR